MVVYKSSMPEILIKYKPGNLPKVKIQSSSDARKMLSEMYNHDTIEYEEQVIVMFLNRANNTLAWQRLSIGGTASCIIDVKKLMATALGVDAHAMIISHNHPSGILKPSDADNAVTERIKKACEIMDIVLVDHLILVKNDFFSYVDEGLLYNNRNTNNMLPI